MIIEKHDHAFVEHLHSESSSPNMRSDSSIPDDIGHTYHNKQLTLDVVILVEYCRNNCKQTSSEHRNYSKVLTLFAPIHMNIFIHAIILVLENSGHYLL